MSRDDDNDDEPTQTTTATDANTKGVTTDATASVIGMRDLPWSKRLNGPHRSKTMAAHNKEFSGLTSTILQEFFPGEAEYAASEAIPGEVCIVPPIAFRPPASALPFL